MYKKFTLIGSIALALLSYSVILSYAKDSMHKSTYIKIIIEDNINIFAELNNNKTSIDFIKNLPQKLPMTRLYDREYYTRLPFVLHIDNDSLQREYEDGDIAYWPSQGYFGILFSHTKPVSSPIIIMGKISSGIEHLKNMRESEIMTFELQ